MGLGRGRKKGSRRPGSWHHSEVSSQVSSDLNMAGRNPKLRRESVPSWEKPGPVTGSLGHLLTDDGWSPDDGWGICPVP